MLRIFRSYRGASGEGRFHGVAFAGLHRRMQHGTAGRVSSGGQRFIFRQQWLQSSGIAGECRTKGERFAHGRVVAFHGGRGGGGQYPTVAGAFTPRRCWSGGLALVLFE